jgi:hypothetical protein
MAQYLDSLDFPPVAAPTGVTPVTAPPPERPRPQPPSAVASWLASSPDWLNEEVEVSVATYQAYQIMYYAFIALMAVTGLDKFLHILTTWEVYVSPAMSSLLHMSPGALSIFAGLIELAAATAVALKPRIGSWVVTVWLWLIVVNLLTMSGHYDLVVSDLALSAAALAFTRLSAECN